MSALGLFPGDPVWLVPRTVTAPLVCYGRPRAVVKSVEYPFLIVVVDGREYRLHYDNVRRTDPDREHRAAALRGPKPRPTLPAGCEEVPLW